MSSDLFGFDRDTARRPRFTEGFAVFWNIYPRRVAKEDAMKAWDQVRPSHEDVEKMRVALGWQVSTVAWVKDDGAFVPYPATYIRGRRWNDERPPDRPQMSERTARSMRAIHGQ